MKTKVLISLFACIVLSGTVFAQEPPAWVNLGELSNASQVCDILEISGMNIILAAGYSSSYSDGAIWKSTNKGQTWTQIARLATYYATLLRLYRDSTSGSLWTFWKGSGQNVLYYSIDNGNNWTGVSTPASNPAVTACAIEIVGNYVYFGGTISNPYDIALYRLDQTSLAWEMVRIYPECNAISYLKFHDGKLIVFARDSSSSKIRVFSHTPAELGKRAINVGKAEISETVGIK